MSDNDTTPRPQPLAPATPEAYLAAPPQAQLREVPTTQAMPAPSQDTPVTSGPQPQGAYAALPPGMVMPNITIVNTNTAAQTGAGVLVLGQKSLGLALVLTFFFGPLGMLYSTVPGAIMTFIIGFVSLLLGGWVVVVILWPIELIWTYTGVKKHNARLYLRAA